MFYESRGLPIFSNTCMMAQNVVVLLLMLILKPTIKVIFRLSVRVVRVCIVFRLKTNRFKSATGVCDALTVCTAC